MAPRYIYTPRRESLAIGAKLAHPPQPFTFTYANREGVNFTIAICPNNRNTDGSLMPARLGMTL